MQRLEGPSNHERGQRAVQHDGGGAQGATDMLEREKRADQRGLHAKELGPLKDFGKLPLEASRKMYWRG